MLDWIQQTFVGVRSLPIEPPRFAHPDLAESVSAAIATRRSADASARSRKRLEKGPQNVDDLYRAASVAGGTAAFESQDGEAAAVAF